MRFWFRMLAFVSLGAHCLAIGLANAEPLPAPFGHVIVVGDSISRYDQDSLSFCYPDYLAVPDVIDNYAVPGSRLITQIAGTFAANLAQSPAADAVIIQGGVNDLINWNGQQPGYNVLRSRLRNAVTGMVREARASQLQHILLVSILPWRGHGSWSAQKQQLTEEHNAWLQNYAATVNAVFVDAYTEVRSSSGSGQRMAAAYGGGLHPNEAGAQAIAALVDQQILAYRAQFTPVALTVAPWSSSREIRLDSDPYIVAAIAGSSSQAGDAHDFDVTRVDSMTLAFGPGAAPNTTAYPQLSDFNGDGNVDAAYLFATAESGILCGDTAVLLTGTTHDGMQFAGSSPVETIDCEVAGCHP